MSHQRSCLQSKLPLSICHFHEICPMICCGHPTTASNPCSGGRFEYCHSPNCGGNGGLLLIWNDDWDVEIKSYSIGRIDALVTSLGLPQWRFLLAFMICGGNFNEILSLIEKNEGVDRNIGAMNEFQKVLDHYGFDDLGYECPIIYGEFTNSDHRPIRAKLDNTSQQTQKKLKKLVSVVASTVDMEEVRRVEIKLEDLMDRRIILETTLTF
ncbi:hypothetical protein F8388_001381 [Cannabis sativa]|uniref:Uncharacterized protein n=1 Tax=Cannabis sativa TaxID=3483 RepID=A0A7J6GMM6_CANSA|nr:hypothetical protein F8388_001381 [Cannabis sativa]